LSTARVTRLAAASSLMPSAIADVAQRFFFEEFQQHGVAVLRAELVQALVEQRRQLFPTIGVVRVGDLVGARHLGCLPLVVFAMCFRPPRVGGAVAGRLQQPRRQRPVRRHLVRLLRKDDEDGLRDVLGQVRVARSCRRAAE
jgi:hypothetical protein